MFRNRQKPRDYTRKWSRSSEPRAKGPKGPKGRGKKRKVGIQEDGGFVSLPVCIPRCRQQPQKYICAGERRQKKARHNGVRAAWPKTRTRFIGTSVLFDLSLRNTVLVSLRQVPRNFRWIEETCVDESAMTRGWHKTSCLHVSLLSVCFSPSLWLAETAKDGKLGYNVGELKTLVEETFSKDVDFWNEESAFSFFYIRETVCF